MTETNSLPVYKIVVVGDSGVGKTSVVHRFCKNEFGDDIGPTIGSACIKKTMDTGNGVIIMNIWDTAGQERFQSLIPMYLRDANVCIFVVDLSRKELYEEMTAYYDYIYDQLDPDCYFCVCANKSDLIKTSEDIAPVKNFSKQHGCTWFEASAKTGQGINELFSEIALRLLQIDTNKADIGQLKRAKSEKGCC